MSDDSTTHPPFSGRVPDRGRRPVTIDLEADRLSGADAAALEPREAAHPTGDLSGTHDAAVADPAISESGGTSGIHAEPTPAASTEEPPAEASPSAFAAGPSAPVPPHPASQRHDPQPRRGTSFPLLLLSAVLGGLLALGGAYLAGMLLPRGGAAGVDPQLRADVEALRSQGESTRAELAALQATPPATADTAPLREELAGLQTAVAELRDRPVAGPVAGDPAAVDDLRSRVEALEQRVEATAATPSPAGTGGPAPAPALEAELAGMRATLGEVSALQPAVADLGNRLDDLGRRIEALEARPPPDLSGLEGGIAELRTGLQGLTERVETDTAGQRLSALEPEVAAARSRADQALGLAPVVAADALAEAVNAGRPFAAELAALRAAGADDPAIAELEPHAQAGLPSPAALADEFAALAANLQTARPIPRSAGPVDRLLQSARGLVEIRPAGDTATGSDPGSVMARVEEDLRRGAFGEALADWERLPEASKAATAEWAGRVRARLTAESLAARLRTDALARIGARS